MNVVAPAARFWHHPLEHPTPMYGYDRAPDDDGGDCDGDDGHYDGGGGDGDGDCDDHVYGDGDGDDVDEADDGDGDAGEYASHDGDCDCEIDGGDDADAGDCHDGDSDHDDGALWYDVFLVFVFGKYLCRSVHLV